MKKIALTGLVIGVAMIAGQAQAAAFNPLNPGLVPDTAKTYMAGSSAATPLIEKSFDGVCVGTISRYSANGSLAWGCNDTTGNGIILNKRESGGSITGIVAASPFNQQQSYINFGAFTAANTISCVAAPQAGFQDCTIAGTVPAINHASELNFSDVDGAQFESPLNGGVKGAGAVAGTPIATQIFGVVVNLDLRNAMQDAMVAAGVLPASCNAGGVNSESEACMANLTTAQISSLFAGKIPTNASVTDWRQIRYGKTAATENMITQQGANAPTNRTVHICSRTAGSGTLAAFQSIFLNAPCNGGLDEAAVMPSAQNINLSVENAGATTKAIHAMSGSGDVENCLVGLDSGAATGTFSPLPTGVVGKRWAIGIMGTERNLNNSKPYRFIKIDNVSPAAHNVVEGRYRYWAELQRNGSAPTDPVAIAIENNMKNPANIAPLIATPSNTFGITQLLGLPTTPGTVNAGFQAANPINPYTHAPTLSGAPNVCRVQSIKNFNSPATSLMPTFYPAY